MTENTDSLVLHFELTDPTATENAPQLASELQRRLEQLDEVQAVQAKAEEQRFTGIEIAAGITAAVVVVRAGRELTEELTRLIPAIRALIAEIKGITGAAVEIDDEIVPLEEVTDEQLKQLATSA